MGVKNCEWGSKHADGSLKAWVRDKTCGWGSKRVGGGSKKVGEGSKSVGEGQIVWVGLETSGGGSKRVGDRRNMWLGLETSGCGVKKGWVGPKTQETHIQLLVHAFRDLWVLERWLGPG